MNSDFLCGGELGCKSKRWQTLRRHIAVSCPGEEVGLFWATVHLFMFFNYSNKKFILLCHLFAVLLKGLKIIPDEKDFFI